MTKDDVVEEYIYTCYHCNLSYPVPAKKGFTTPRCPKCHYALTWIPRLTNKIENPNGEDITLSDLIQKYQKGELVKITKEEAYRIIQILKYGFVVKDDKADQNIIAKLKPISEK